MHIAREARVDTWEECVERLVQIERENSDSVTGVWFRGQADASWRLATTLERYAPDREWTFIGYKGLVDRILPRIEMMTGRSWAERPRIRKIYLPIEEAVRNSLDYDLMAYLRHHGFPSPLLDWSLSPYIASYFAFAPPQIKGDVAIYAYCEMPQNAKWAGDGPRIVGHGGYNLKPHERHFRQKTCYTVCVDQNPPIENDTHQLNKHITLILRSLKFAPHDLVLQKKNRDQDVLYKTIVPGSERIKALKYLDKFNLNSYSLFGSEESLMETLAVSEIDLRRK